MAKIKGHNLFLLGASGALADQLVVRQTRHGVVLSAAPVWQKREFTPAQKEHQNRFRLAAKWASAHKTDPPYVAAAAEDGNRTAFNLAHRDYMRAPTIHDIDVTDYKGASGDTILIVAIDDFAVQAVTVEIRQNGTVLESGPATNFADDTVWHYTVRQQAYPGAVEIHVTAADLPGNKTSDSVAVNIA